MIIDTSAVIAILLGEPDSARLEEVIAGDLFPRISAASYLEAGIVVDSRKDPVRSRMLDDFLAGSDIAIEPVTAQQALIARDAYRDFGKGSGHAAKLNFGDCLAYALAKATGEALLFKGDDFIHTDVIPATR